MVAITSAGTIIIDERLMSDFADGDIGTVEPVGEIATVKRGKDGNAVFASNESGFQCNHTIRLLRGSSDDIYMNSRLTSQRANFAGLKLMNASVIKPIGDGDGGSVRDIYTLENGVIGSLPATKINIEGDTEQAIVVYSIMFSNAKITKE